MHKMPATMTIRDDGGHLAVLIERGWGWEVVLTTPTHRGAQVPDARVRGMAEAQDRAASVVEDYRRIYDVTVVDGEPCDECDGTRWPTEYHRRHCSLHAA